MFSESLCGFSQSFLVNADAEYVCVVCVRVCVYIYIYTHTYMYTYVYVYVYMYLRKVHPRTGHEFPEAEKMCSSTLSLTSALNVGDQRHAPAALPPGKRPGTHCIGGWVGPMGRFEQVRKISHRDSIPRPSSR